MGTLDDKLLDALAIVFARAAVDKLLDDTLNSDKVAIDLEAMAAAENPVHEPRST
jgi:hypothetical protein